ncbi:HNH endonuclease [Vibrio fluvialis]|nr:HNH endonuclease [Vibrio fluvialis]
MAISDKTRKILWGKSGTKCAICKQSLVFERTTQDSESVVGEECHIVSGAKQGPRSDLEFPRDKIDDVSNLILLCRVHHKQIDDQVETFTPELLRTIKCNHETWVEEKLKETPQSPKVRIVRDKAEIPEKLSIVHTGKEIFEKMSGCLASYMDYSDNLSDEELDLVANFLQNIKDWSEFAQDLEPVQKINASRDINNELIALRERGLYAFAAVEIQRMVGGIGGESSFPVLHLTVNKADDPNVVSE